MLRSCNLHFKSAPSCYHLSSYTETLVAGSVEGFDDADLFKLFSVQLKHTWCSWPCSKTEHVADDNVTIEVNWFKASQLEQFNNPVRDSSESYWCLHAWGDGAEPVI